jgi:hypothetical protein
MTCLEFFKFNMESREDDMLAIFNQKYLDGRIMASQVHGIIVCILKTDSLSSSADQTN